MKMLNLTRMTLELFNVSTILNYSYKEVSASICQTPKVDSKAIG